MCSLTCEPSVEKLMRLRAKMEQPMKKMPKANRIANAPLAQSDRSAEQKDRAMQMKLTRI
jgi:hypothetical protein